MTNTSIEELRTGDNPIKEMQEIVKAVQEEEKEIDIPERSELENQEIWLKDEPDGNVNINGHWVHPLYARINNMMANNQSPIIMVVGKEGKGKSMTALEICRKLHNQLNILRGSFNPERQTVYQVIEFLMLVRQSTRTALMFDEANETLNSNQYNTKMNHAVAGSLRTQRKRENLYLFIGPEYKEFDSRIRKKVDILIEMVGNQYAKVRSYKMKHGKRGNRGLDYNYTDYPDWKVPTVPEQLQETYNKIDNQFKGKYLDQLLIQVLNEKMEELEEQQTAKL